MSSRAKQRLLSDSDEQVREKVHGIFACSTRQSNWRATFTPSKNSVFSRQQLTSLYCKAATVITNVLLAIASNLHAATVVPRAPGQRRNCSFWLFLNLCGENSMKSNILLVSIFIHHLITVKDVTAHCVVNLLTSHGNCLKVVGIHFIFPA